MHHVRPHWGAMTHAIRKIVTHSVNDLVIHWCDDRASTDGGLHDILARRDARECVRRDGLVSHHSIGLNRPNKSTCYNLLTFTAGYVIVTYDLDGIPSESSGR